MDLWRGQRSSRDWNIDRTDDLAGGFDSTDARFTQLFDEINDDFQPDLLAPATSWHGSWVHPDNSSRAVRMSIEQIEINDLRWKFSRDFTHLAAEATEVVDAAGNITITIDRSDQSLRYNSGTQLLITLYTTSRQDVPADIIENQLGEVDLDTWTELVGPFNADPLNPR